MLVLGLMRTALRFIYDAFRITYGNWSESCCCWVLWKWAGLAWNAWVSWLLELLKISAFWLMPWLGDWRGWKFWLCMRLLPIWSCCGVLWLRPALAASSGAASFAKAWPVWVSSQSTLFTRYWLSVPFACLVGYWIWLVPGYKDWWFCDYILFGVWCALCTILFISISAGSLKQSWLGAGLLLSKCDEASCRLSAVLWMPWP